MNRHRAADAVTSEEQKTSNIHSISEVIIQTVSISEGTRHSQRTMRSRTLFETREVAGSAIYKQSKAV